MRTDTRTRRSRLLAALGLASLITVTAACGPSASSPATGPGDAATTPAAEAAALMVGISVHVEGWTGEGSDPELFARHRDAILSLARTAADAGAVLTLELSPAFIAGAQAFDPEIVDDLRALGHEVALHADIGGQGTPSEAAMTLLLVTMRAELADLGADATHVSGICSRGPWVEAALAAGFTSTSGAVAYCATSMDPDLLTEDQAWVLDCASPIACHAAPPVDEHHRWNPFMSDSSRDWMLADDPSGLVIVVGGAGGGIHCPASVEEEAGTARDACVPDDSDLPALAASLAAALAAREPGETHALTFSWSIGTVPSETFATEVFAVFADAVASGDAIWAGLSTIAATAAGAPSGSLT
jgi:hypothetical protein